MIEWIVTSSVLIVLVLLLRAAVKDRISPRLRYALGLVLLRLMLPVSLWESEASVMGPVAAQEAYQAVEQIPRYVRTDSDGGVMIGSETGWRFLPKETVEHWEPSMESELTALRRQVNIRDTLFLIWLAGIGVFGALFLAVNLRFGYTLRKTRRRTGQYRNRPVYEAEGLPSPCLFGLFRPAVYLTPDVAAEGSAREHVLAHEYTHFRQGDHIWAMFRGVCLALHWYNPLVWLAAVQSRRDCEISCDEGAVKLLGEDRRADYGRTLVDLVARRTALRDLACCATTMTGGKSAVKERITLLIKHPRTTAAMAILVAAACSGMAVCTFTGAKTAKSDIPAEPDLTEPLVPEDTPAPEPSGALPENAAQLEIPMDLPTELMDLSRPAEEQGEWLLLAQAPASDIALYRSAADDQTVYLRVTNQSFQAFARDLSGMELLPTLDLWEGDAELAVQVLYRRYEGTYFNGISDEPGIVGDPVIYIWNPTEKYWTERYISTQPAQILTEDVPALSDLPERLVTPGSPEEQADMWRIAELPADGISVYYEQSTGKIWLRYGDAIQTVEGMSVCMPQMLLPDLYFADPDGDGDRELIAISQDAAGSGVSAELLSVYEWDGERWVWDTHDPVWIAEDFNRHRNYQFYDGGMAYINYEGIGLLLDLTNLWDLGYWDSTPDMCVLSAAQVHYTWQDGQLAMVLGGEILDSGGPFLHGWAFEYDCAVAYYDYRDGGPGHLLSESGTLRSDFAAEPVQPDLTDAYRAILTKTLAACERTYPNVFAVHDVDRDGAAELLVRWKPAGSMSSAWGTSVYSASGAEIFHGHGNLTFYSNGVLSEPWSHNQGPACAIWPYTLHRPVSQRYLEVGSARAMDDTVDSFPREADLDGDGMVFYIDSDAYWENNPVDNDVYEAWLGQHLQGAEILPVQYFPLTAEMLEELP